MGLPVEYNDGLNSKYAKTYFIGGNNHNQFDTLKLNISNIKILRVMEDAVNKYCEDSKVITLDGRDLTCEKQISN